MREDPGDDLLIGGAGTDVVTAGRGDDVLWGDPVPDPDQLPHVSRDTFWITGCFGHDVIEDFQPWDTLQLSYAITNAAGFDTDLNGTLNQGDAGVDEHEGRLRLNFAALNWGSTNPDQFPWTQDCAPVLEITGLTELPLADIEAG